METIQLITHLISLIGGTFALLLYAQKNKHLALQMSAWFLIGSGAICVLGYAVQTTSHFTLPRDSTPMAFSTGVCFMVTGAAILILSNYCGDHSGK